MLSRLRGKKPTGPVMPKEDFLKLVPIRNPTIKWEKYPTGEVSIDVPLGKSRRKGVVGKLFMPQTPRKKRVVFDRIGSYVWEQCDGKNTVEDLVGLLCEKHRLTRREAEVPLMIHLRNLGKRGFIGLLPKEALSAKPTQ